MNHPSTVADTLDAGDGWIAWAGGECPVDPASIVDVKFRGHPDCYGRHAWEHDDVIDAFSCWHHSKTEPDSSDIIAYRVVQP